MDASPKRPFRPSVECLEDRTLAAAHVTASLSGGVLRIEGTNHADTIVVREAHGQISINGVEVRVRGGRHVHSVSAASVRRIEVEGRGGNDRIDVNSVAGRGRQAITRPVIVRGGAGDDVIWGGAGSDKIYGGAGNDTLHGGGGNDLLDGEAGRDRLLGDAGNDALVADRAVDRLDGGRGRDTARLLYFTRSAPASLRGIERVLGVRHATGHARPAHGKPGHARAAHAASAHSKPKHAGAGSLGADAERLLRMTNSFRAEHGQAPLVLNPRLQAAARTQANFMAQTGQYAHTHADGTGLADRLHAAGFAYAWGAENIHLYRPSAGQGLSAGQLPGYFFDGWAGSPAHRENLLDARATATGIALARAQNGDVYAAQVFGRPL